MLVRQNITFPMATNFSEETNIFSRGAQMPVTIQHDDSDSDSNVSSEDLPTYTDLLNVQTPTGAAGEVKLELRNVIRTRREARGLDGMPYLEPKKPKREGLTFEEEEKRRIRRERNKIAAFKCRQRRKEHVQQLQAESDVLSAERSTLEREIAALKAQKEQLAQMVHSHNCVLKDGESKECQDYKSEAKSPQTCSSEVAKSSDAVSPTGSVDSVKV